MTWWFKLLVASLAVIQMKLVYRLGWCSDDLSSAAQTQQFSADTTINQNLNIFAICCWAEHWALSRPGLNWETLFDCQFNKGPHCLACLHWTFEQSKHYRRRSEFNGGRCSMFLSVPCVVWWWRLLWHDLHLLQLNVGRLKVETSSLLHRAPGQLSWQPRLTITKPPSPADWVWKHELYTSQAAD